MKCKKLCGKNISSLTSPVKRDKATLSHELQRAKKVAFFLTLPKKSDMFLEMKNLATVQDLINKLNSIPDKTLPVFLRSKYTGDVKWCDEHSIHLNGVSEMEKDGKINRVVFLY